MDDFGLYSTEQPTVPKIELPSRSLCADWSPDGQILAIGLFSGSVLLRDKQGEALVLKNIIFDINYREKLSVEVLLGVYNLIPLSLRQLTILLL